jgi:hypothetical protein
MNKNLFKLLKNLLILIKRKKEYSQQIKVSKNLKEKGIMRKYLKKMKIIEVFQQILINT